MSPSTIKRQLQLERKRVLLFAHVFALIVYTLFIVHDYIILNQPQTALVEVGFLLVILLNLILLYRKESFGITACILLAVISIEVLFSIISVFNEPEVVREIFWSVILAPAAYYLLGRKGGLAFASLVLASVWGLYFLFRSNDSHVLSLSTMADYTGIYTIVTLIAYLYARSQSLNIQRMISYSRDLTYANDELKTAALTDTLTLTYNRKFLDEVLLELCTRKGDEVKFSLIMFDIDHFKKVNDTHGHQVGDEILSEVTRATRRQLRDNDILGRWGGEEFMIVSPGMGADDAMGLAERLRKHIQDYEFSHGLKIRCSFGVAEYVPEETSQSLIQRADQALYKAKKEGRNRTALSPAQAV
ncbi:MAG: GGDEF domain-containing protein [Gammaproteobacteria bacterium]|nr:GGDEF domain-containing protein [Gammaproteobacteria bacterium]